MLKHLSLSAWVLSIVVLQVLCVKPTGAAPARPNVILVMTDDQGYGDLACHGNPYIQTPNLDRFHHQSIRLTNYHVGPTCAPTRAALMTGRYCNRTGVWHTVGGRSLLRRDETTMAEIFARAGYRTAIFGKWHLGDNYPYRPEDRGFHETLVHGGGGVTQAPDYWGNDYFNDTYRHNGVWKKYQGYCTDVWFENAFSFIRANRDRPFFVYIPTNAPHGPYYVDPKYSEPYSNNPNIPNPAFYGMITQFDENFGRLRQLLEQLDLEDNTILIFTTDNGTAAGYRNNKGFNAGMKGTKGSEYDGGHRVPCFIRYPAGRLSPPADIGRLTAHIDLLPTLMELCGIDNPGIRFDGTSLVPLLKNPQAPWPQRTLVTDSQRIEHPEKWRKSATMTDRWRLVNGRELYDMTTDPGQQNNVAADHPDIVARLRQDYESWWQSVSVRFDDYPPIVIGSDAEAETQISSHDWHSDTYPWNQYQIRKAMIGNGFWVIDVERAGTYRFELRRWPKAADLAINAGTPDVLNEIGKPYGPGKALAIRQARLQIGTFDQTIPVRPGDKAAVFTVKLQAGPTRMQSWFIREDANAKSLGAYYVYARRVGD